MIAGTPATIAMKRRKPLGDTTGVIPGVQRLAITPHNDARGTLRELWRRSSQPIDLQQVLVTSSVPGALRGMHFHLRQADVCYVVSGRIAMALVDLRTSALTKDEFWLTDSESVFIPAGVAHGYATDQGATVCYLLTQEVDGSDEFGFAFDAPEVGIKWPVAAPVLSERDRTAGSVQAALATVRALFQGRAEAHTL